MAKSLWDALQEASVSLPTARDKPDGKVGAEYAQYRVNGKVVHITSTAFNFMDVLRRYPSDFQDAAIGFLEKTLQKPGASETFNADGFHLVSVSQNVGPFHATKLSDGEGHATLLFSR